MANPTQERLKELFDYNPETGILVYRVNRNSRARAGKEAGVWDNGYRKVQIDGRQYMTHRIVWAYMTGEWPPEFIDHINCIRGDNRFCNLRLATAAENTANAKAGPSALGIKGVRKVGNRYRAQGFHLHLGYFETAEDAQAAYMAKARELYGEFARAA